MNVDALNTLTNGMDKKRLTARLRSLASNVLRESKVAHGRADEPFTDDDAQRMDMIFELLHLAAQEEIVKEYEHFPLVSEKQTKADPRLDKIADLLADELITEPEINTTELTITAQPIKKAIKG
jgi:hypothetical protein